MKVFLLLLAVAGACRISDDCVLCSRDCYYLILEGGGGICSPNLDYGGDFVGVVPRGSSIMCPNDPQTHSTSSTLAPPQESIMKPVTHFDNNVGGSSTHHYNVIVREENVEIIGKKLPDSNQMDYNAIVREENVEILGKVLPDPEKMDYNAIVREENVEIFRKIAITTLPSPQYSTVTSSSAPISSTVSPSSTSSSGWVVAGAIASVVFIFVILLLVGFKLRKAIGRAYHRHHDELHPSDLV